MATPYAVIYDNVLSKFQSYEIPLMNIEDVESYLLDYLSPAIVAFHIARVDLTDRDEKGFNADLSETEIDILSNYMLITYVDSNYIRVPNLLKVHLSSRDFNSYSPANMLDRLMAMRNKYVQENETLLTRYAWLNGVDSILKYKRK